jgi:hypothetical protein
MVMPKLDRKLLIAETITNIREKLNELPKYNIDKKLTEDKNGKFVAIDSVKKLLLEQMRDV